MSESMPEGMGRCEVTGNVVPEDELVVIRGKRVSAEGKAILLDRLSAGEEAPGELMTASFSRRFFSWLIDNAIFGGTSYALVSTLFVSTGTLGLLVNWRYQVVMLLFAVVKTLYFGLMHGLKGQTLGKICMKVKVVRMDGRPMDIKTGLVRSLVLNAFDMVNSIILFANMSFVVAILGIGALFYFIANFILTIADSKEQRSIHDRVADTRVIMNES